MKPCLVFCGDRVIVDFRSKKELSAHGLEFRISIHAEPSHLPLIFEFLWRSTKSTTCDDPLGLKGAVATSHDKCRFTDFVPLDSNLPRTQLCTSHVTSDSCAQFHEFVFWCAQLVYSFADSTRYSNRERQKTSQALSSRRHPRWSALGRRPDCGCDRDFQSLESCK